jgi:hypothetical protein
MSSSGRDSQDWSCFGSWSTLTRAHFWLFFGGVYKASHRLHVLSTSIYPVPSVQLSINMINILSELRVPEIVFSLHADVFKPSRAFPTQILCRPPDTVP